MDEIKDMIEQPEKASSLPTGCPSSTRMARVHPSDLKRATCVILYLSPFVEMSDVLAILTLFSPFHILHVLLIFATWFGFHTLLPHFPCIPFPGRSVPPQAAGSFQGNLLHYQDGKSGTLFEEQNWERGPESLPQASTMAVMYLQSER